MSTAQTENTTELAQAVMYTLDDWGLDGEAILAVLALPGEIRTRHLQRYRQGSTAFPDDEATWQRIEHVVGIADALRTTYPLNANMRRIWLRTPHRRFRRRTPLELIIDDGLNGLIRVRSELDCAWGWRQME